MCVLFTLSILINHNSRDICCQNCKLHSGLSLWMIRIQTRGAWELIIGKGRVLKGTLGPSFGVLPHWLLVTKPFQRG